MAEHAVADQAATTESVVEDPVLRQRLIFRRRADADGAEVLEVEFWVDPGGGVTPHIHPSIDETFIVKSGHPSFLAGRQWSTAAPGDVVKVPAGTRHAYRNRGDETAHVVCEARPPGELQEFLEDVARMSRAGVIMRPGLPKGISGLLQGIVLAHHYREMAVLMFPPFPPPALQRVLFPPLLRLAARRGYRAGSLGTS